MKPVNFNKPVKVYCTTSELAVHVDFLTSTAITDIFNYYTRHENYIQIAKSVLKGSGIDDLLRFVESAENQWEKELLNIAITGSSGGGK